MPDICKGILKIRGRKNNVLAFLAYGVYPPIMPNGNKIGTSRMNKVIKAEEYRLLIERIDQEIAKDTKADEITVFAEIKHAWGSISDRLDEIGKEHNIKFDLTEREIIVDDKAVICYWGRTGEVGMVTAEECGELIQAVTKIERYGMDEERMDHLTEEIADCLICIDGCIEEYRLSVDPDDVDLVETGKKYPAEYLIGCLGDLISDMGIILLKGGYSTKQISVTASNVLYGINQLIIKYDIDRSKIKLWRTAKIKRLTKRMRSVEK